MSTHPANEPTSGLSRRSLLRGIGLGAGALAAGGVGSAWLAGCSSSGSTSSSGAATGGKAALKPVKLGWWGATCEAPVYVAYHEGFFAREGLKVDLVNLGQASAKDAIASGKVDGAPGITFEWLKPIEQGQDIRVTGGLHGGCLRLVTDKKLGITDLAGLKGKTLATDQIGGSAHSFFSVVLAKAGIDPQKDVKFVAYPGAQLETAVQRGEVAGVAAADPFPFLIVADGVGTELSSNLTGAYKDHYCCAIGLNGALIDESPQTAAAVTRAWLSAAKWIGSNVDKTARIEADNKYVPIDAAVAAKLLSTYYWTPSVTRLQANIGQYSEEFKVTGILDKGTDPAALAKKAFADVTGGDTGIDGSDPTVKPSASAAPSSAGALGRYGNTGSSYQLTAAQKEQLRAFACQHGGASPAGKVA
jgi:NitT/TauT family transport system substrate-binding protein